MTWFFSRFSCVCRHSHPQRCQRRGWLLSVKREEENTWWGWSACRYCYYHHQKDLAEEGVIPCTTNYFRGKSLIGIEVPDGTWLCRICGKEALPDSDGCKEHRLKRAMV